MLVMLEHDACKFEIQIMIRMQIQIALFLLYDHHHIIINSLKYGNFAKR